MTNAMRQFVLGALTLVLASVLFGLSVFTVAPGGRAAGPAPAITFTLLVAAVLFNAVTILAWLSAIRSAHREHGRVLAGMIAATSVAAVAFVLVAM